MLCWVRVWVRVRVGLGLRGRVRVRGLHEAIYRV